MSDDFLDRVKPDPNYPTIFSVALHTGEVWKLNSPMPGDENSQTKVIRIMPSEDGVDVFVLPTVGSPDDAQKTAHVHTIYQIAIKQLLTIARFDVWREMLLGSVDMTSTICPRCKQDIEGDEEDEEIQTAPILPQPVVSTNGASS